MMKELTWVAKQMGFKSVNDDIKTTYARTYKGYIYVIKRLSMLDEKKYRDLDSTKQNDVWLTGYVYVPIDDRFLKLDRDEQDEKLKFYGGITYDELKADLSNNRFRVLGFDTLHGATFENATATSDDYDECPYKIWSIEGIEGLLKESIDAIIEYDKHPQKEHEHVKGLMHYAAPDDLFFGNAR